MSWDQIQNLYAGQGIVFWAAVTAVALGLTLLSVSIVFQLRKMLAGRRFALRRPAPRIAVDETGYRPEGFVPEAVASGAVAPDLETPDIAAQADEAVLARLRIAAERLERIHADLSGSGSTAQSPLKQTDSAVDYVYRTGRA